jgi:hypothetical protein
MAALAPSDDVHADPDSADPDAADLDAPGYEFSALENKRFTRLAGAMQTVSVLEVMAGLLGIAPAWPAAVQGFSEGKVLASLLPVAAVVVPVLVGVWTYRAGGHLRLIVRTQGDDIAHLMAAMGELTKLYILQIWLFLMAVGAVIFSLVAHGAFLKLY